MNAKGCRKNDHLKVFEYRRQGKVKNAQSSMQPERIEQSLGEKQLVKKGNE